MLIKVLKIYIFGRKGEFLHKPFLLRHLCILAKKRLLGKLMCFPHGLWFYPWFLKCRQSSLFCRWLQFTLSCSCLVVVAVPCYIEAKILLNRGECKLHLGCAVSWGEILIGWKYRSLMLLIGRQTVETAGAGSGVYFGGENRCRGGLGEEFWVMVSLATCRE